MSKAQQSSTITQSQRIYIIEVLFILLPVTLFTSVMLAPFVIDSAEAITKNLFKTEMLLAAWPLLVTTIFISAWYLSLTFINRGTEGIKKAKLLPVLFCWLGAAWIITAALSTLFIKENIFAVIFLFGSPALIPFSHIVYERHIKKTSKTLTQI